MRCSYFIIFHLLAFDMICAINFYDQHLVKANKINDIIVNDVLPPKVQP